MLASWQHLDMPLLRAFRDRCGLGEWMRSQLFVGPGWTLSPCHYDQYDNLFLQVRGEKHFLLFDPRAAEGLYPFPASHPYDEYCMVDLEKVDHKSFPATYNCLASR